MIVDTSALVALLKREAGYELIRDALLTEGALLPTPALVEYHRVTSHRGSMPHGGATALAAKLFSRGLRPEPFTGEDAALAARANIEHGLGNGRGGTLNMIDLMVYAVAKRLDRPILCTGRDYAATGIAIHPASRLDQPKS